MNRRSALSLLSLALLAVPLNATDVQVRVTGLSAGPKAQGTTSQPLRLIPGAADIPQIPADADIRTVDGAQGELPIMAPELLGQREAGLMKVIAPAGGLQAVPASPEASLADAAQAEPATGRVETGAQGELKYAAGAPEAAASQAPAEELGLQGDETFDGTKESAAAPAAMSGSRLGRWVNSAGLSLGRGARRFVPHGILDRLNAQKPPSTADQWGGPKELKLDFKGKLLYGLKWGFNMIGLGALLQYSALALEKVFPWQLHVSDSILESTGRVELLARLGPKAINTALTSDPFHFLFVQLPMATAWEELVSRVLGFGVLWTLLAAIKPFAGSLSKWLENVPDLFSLRSITQTALAVAGKVSSKAFPIAALLSAASFAASHFAAWGVSPYFASVHLVMGFSLAYVAYKTRSVVVPFIAHYAYNLLTLAGSLLAVHFLLPMGAQIYTGLLGVTGVAYLFFTLRSHQRARSQAKAQAKVNYLLAGPGKVVLPLLLAAVAAGSMFTPGHLGNNFNEAASTKAAQVWPAQDAAPPKPTAPGSTVAEAPKTGSTAAVDLTVAITAKARPAVVKIFSGRGLGSGFVISNDGIVISNAHVTGEAKPGATLRVEFSDGSDGTIKVLAANHHKDIAILQLPKKEGGWTFIPLGDSNALLEGQQVLAMGYPLGLPFTVTGGIVSGLGGGRGSIYVSQMQTDASINHGNSGGPLLNMKGEVIAMNTAIAAPTAESGSIGIGFSIVSEDIKAALAQYQAQGNINSSWLGIIVNFKNPSAPEQGVLIEKVRPGSPAALVGLKDGDLILGVDKRKFAKGRRGFQALAQSIARHMPGDKLLLLVARQGDVSPFTVTLADEK